MGREGVSMSQRDLFPARPAPTPQRATPEAIEPFNFDGSDPRLVPRPDWTPPDELKLPTDDETWMPAGRFG